MLIEKYIMFRKPEDARDFMGQIQKCREDLILSTGRYQIDARSFLSVIALGIGKPIKATYEESEQMTRALEAFAV